MILAIADAYDYDMKWMKFWYLMIFVKILREHLIVVLRLVYIEIVNFMLDKGYDIKEV